MRIDSVDSLKLAERLNEAAGKLGKRLPVLIEVKLSPEETKAGLEPESAECGGVAGAVAGFGASGDAGADDDCALGRGGGCDAGVLSEFAGVAGQVGGGVSAIEVGCVVDGDERGFCGGD